MITAVVLAAGQASRMGRTKQLLPVKGRPMLQHAVDAAAAAGGVDEIVVVLGHDADRVSEALRLPDVARIVVNADFAAGQASSLRTGLEAASPDSEAAVILLGDQPGVSAEAVRAVVEAYRHSRARVVRAAYGSHPGHPILLSRETWPGMAALEGDMGAREVIARHPKWVVDVEVAGPGPPDVDTPEDYERLIAERS